MHFSSMSLRSPACLRFAAVLHMLCMLNTGRFDNARALYALRQQPLPDVALRSQSEMHEMLGKLLLNHALEGDANA